jgi:Flp pilus assembly protein TadD
MAAILPSVAVRLAIVVLALTGAAWLAVELRSSDAQDRMIALAFTNRTPSKADLAEARRLAPRAGRLNPDVRVEETVGVLQLRTGDRAAAVATFERLTRKEPRNAELWAALAQAAQGYDDMLATRARSRARALAPPVRALS